MADAIPCHCHVHQITASHMRSPLAIADSELLVYFPLNQFKSFFQTKKDGDTKTESVLYVFVLRN